jgi:hypothetical protein
MQKFDLSKFDAPRQSARLTGAILQHSRRNSVPDAPAQLRVLGARLNAAMRLQSELPEHMRALLRMLDER